MKTDDNISIFDFDSVSDYLTAIFQQRKARRRGFSLRLWASKLGLKATDSGNLSRVLSGQRDLSKTMQEKIARELALDEDEKAYFEVLALGRDKISAASFARIKDCLREHATETAVESPPDRN